MLEGKQEVGEVTQQRAEVRVWYRTEGRPRQQHSGMERR